jgi:Tfp pilus assembly protein PilN
MLEPYYRIDHTVGVNITISPNGDVVINVCEVAVESKKLDINKKLVELKNIEELANHITPKTYLALNIVGKGVLTKQLEKVEHIDQNNFTHILPNGTFNDFYIQNFISGEQSFVSIIRKSEADKWIGQLIKHGFTPLILSLGAFPIESVLQQLNVYDSEFIFDGHIIQFNEQHNWVSSKYNASAVTTFPLKIESEAIDEKLLLPYAVAFQTVLADRLNLIHANVDQLDAKFQNTIANKKIRAKALITLLVIFILLLANFFLFSFLNTSNNELSEKLNLSAQSTNDLRDINEQVKNKEALLKEMGWDQGINKSSLIDQLAALLPPDVLWREFSIAPIDPSAERTQKKVRFMDDRISIVGTSDKIIPVNEWIARVKTKKWVKNVQLDSYTYNNELNTGQFIIVIDY